MDQKQGKAMLTNLLNRAYVNLSIRLRKEETGATAVECGLIVGLIAVVIVTAVTLLGSTLNGFFETTVTKLGGTVPN